MASKIYLETILNRILRDINEEVKLQTTRRVLVTSRNLKNNKNKSEIKKTSKSALGQDEERPWERGCHDLSENRGGEDRDPKNCSYFVPKT